MSLLLSDQRYHGTKIAKKICQLQQMWNDEMGDITISPAATGFEASDEENHTYHGGNNAEAGTASEEEWDGNTGPRDNTGSPRLAEQHQQPGPNLEPEPEKPKARNTESNG